MKDPEDKQTIEIFKPKGKRGGARIGAGRPLSTGYKTKTFRADIRMAGLIETIKSKLASGAMNDEDLKRFEELAAN
jgi:hypothetical protein